jgi:hypothetical protein
MTSELVSPVIKDEILGNRGFIFIIRNFLKIGLRDE